MTAKASTKSTQIDLHAAQRRSLTVYLIGESPLIVHAWSKKARLMMLAKQMGEKVPQIPKSPNRDFVESLYYLDTGKYGFPATAIKNAMVTACTSAQKEITKVAAKQSFYVKGEAGHMIGASGFETPVDMVPVVSPNPPSMREDAVRIGMTSDLRYRGQFTPWAMIVEIIYNQSVVTQSTVLNLLDIAGMQVGVGEWRPERNGNYGLFRIADKSEIALIKRWQQTKMSDPELIDEDALRQSMRAQLAAYGEEGDETDSVTPPKRKRATKKAKARA